MNHLFHLNHSDLPTLYNVLKNDVIQFLSVYGYIFTVGNVCNVCKTNPESSVKQTDEPCVKKMTFVWNE